MANRSPAFQFYPRDFLADTTHMTAEEVGAYWLIVSSAWLGDKPGYIPNDHELLASMGRLRGKAWGRCSKAILRALKMSDDGEWVYSKRMVAEYEKQQAHVQQASDAGKKSAEARAQRALVRDANGTATGVQRPLNGTPANGATESNSASASASASGDFISIAGAHAWGPSRFRSVWERVTEKSGGVAAQVLLDASAVVQDSARVVGREDVEQYASDLVAALPRVISWLKRSQLGAPALTVNTLLDAKHFSRCEDVVAGRFDPDAPVAPPPTRGGERPDDTNRPTIPSAKKLRYGDED